MAVVISQFDYLGHTSANTLTGGAGRAGQDN